MRQMTMSASRRVFARLVPTTASVPTTPPVVDTRTRPATVDDAERVLTLYRLTPTYFETISNPVPSLAEVQRELEAAAHDPRRYVELVLSPAAEGTDGLRDPETDLIVVGYLDYKLDYPTVGDATVNLLLIAAPYQGQGHGRRCIEGLERRLRGRVKRILAAIYGRNPQAERFWRSLGYRFAIDAKPILDWYAKVLE